MRGYGKTDRDSQWVKVRSKVQQWKMNENEIGNISKCTGQKLVIWLTCSEWYQRSDLLETVIEKKVDVGVKHLSGFGKNLIIVCRTVLK